MFCRTPNQPVFTCSKLAIKTLEQGVNMFKFNNKDTGTTPLTSFWCLYCKLWTYFTLCPSVSIVSFDPSVSIANFEHVIAGREKGLKWLDSGFLAVETFFLSFKMNELTNKFGQTRYAHSEPCQTPKMELFMKIVYGF